MDGRSRVPNVDVDMLSEGRSPSHQGFVPRVLFWYRRSKVPTTQPRAPTAPHESQHSLRSRLILTHHALLDDMEARR